MGYRTGFARTTDTDRDNDAWRQHAACRGTEPGLFYPTTTTRTGERDFNAALAVCAACPVRVDCGEHAHATGETQGIWGGEWLEERQRRSQKAIAARYDRNRAPR